MAFARESLLMTRSDDRHSPLTSAGRNVLDIVTGKSLARTISPGDDDAYDRARVLPRLIALDPADLDRGGAQLDRTIRVRLARALRAERRNGRAGSWTYDLNRHLALLQAIAAEAKRKKSRPA